jgi:hypothetical protein
MGKKVKKREFKENMESLVGYCNIVYKQTTALKLYSILNEDAPRNILVFREVQSYVI